MRLQEAVSFFVDEAHSLSCLSVTCGDTKTLLRARGGVRNLQGDKAESGSLYDLASLTKLFTALSLLRLHEEGLLDLEEKVTAYAPAFRNLEKVSVNQLLGFEIALKTPQRVDTQTDRQHALEQLFAIEPEKNGPRAYSDMHAMVLKYVIEGAAQARYEDVLASKILRPLDMRDTYLHVPGQRLADCVVCDREHRIEGKIWVRRDNPVPGMPHDPKARLLYEEGCGHAGLFSSEDDMVKLCRGILDQKVVSYRTLLSMSVNRTGHPLPDGGYTQYLGSLCYVRHPQQVHSEVPVYMSDRTIALSGFTGHHLSLDPLQGIFVIALGNRVLNRLTVLRPEEGKQMTDYGLHADGTGMIRWKDGEAIWSSAGYVHLKDEHLHRAIADSMGLKAWK